MFTALALLTLLAADAAAPASPCGTVREAEVHFGIDMRLAGKKYLVPFVGFFHTEADLVMDVSPHESGVLLFLRKPLRPAYTLQSMGRLATEMQARVLGASADEAQTAGQAALAQFVRQQPDVDKSIPADQRKIVPFVYDGPPAGKFQFVVGRDGRVLRGRNDVKGKALWPTEAYPHVFEALVRALDFLSSPAINIAAAGNTFSAQIPEAQAATVLGQVCGTIVPKVKDELALVQKEAFNVTVTGARGEDGTITIEGKATPQLSLKDDLVMTSFSFSRRLCADGTPLAMSMDMQVRGQHSNGGAVSLSVVFK
jgi:hypothetical protein